ncbi:hypothetical protein [uncultured Gimesia sp.]|uniref:hypothetical protein n=1 Tax=uncultured Gimesia sp. TaxID=1678688 RepID=UPI0026060EBA|nr:hypothetical protein [uncultured Gimesia sp.]
MSEKTWYDLSDIADLVPKRMIKETNYFNGNFSECNRFNIPGLFYGAMTDTCLTGPQEAPFNVMVDDVGQEFIFRQPTDLFELDCILQAANFDPFEGYGADGDVHWTLRLIREWWESCDDLLDEVESLRQHNENVKEWKQYLLGPAIEYLRQYAFFVEEGKRPLAFDVLPIL